MNIDFPKLLPQSRAPGPLGVNPGAAMIDQDGTEWYVKAARSRSHAVNELAANALYQLAGVPVPRLASNGLLLASRMEDVTPWFCQAGAALERSKERICRDFVVDAWLANWDAPVGGNISIRNSDGEPLRIDVGGALDFRARGDRRRLAHAVLELSTMRDPAMSPWGARLYGSTTWDDETSSVARILAIPETAIREAVDNVGAPARLHADVISRRSWLSDYYAHARQGRRWQ